MIDLSRYQIVVIRCHASCRAGRNPQWAARDSLPTVQQLLQLHDIALTVRASQREAKLGAGHAKSTRMAPGSPPTLTTHRSLRTSSSRILAGSNCSISTMQRKQTRSAHDQRSRCPMQLAQLIPTEATRPASERVTLTGKFNFFASSTTPAQTFSDTKTWHSHSPTDWLRVAPTRTTRWVDERRRPRLAAPKTGRTSSKPAGI